jgi:hypothetical protein
MLSALCLGAIDGEVECYKDFSTHFGAKPRLEALILEVDAGRELVTHRVEAEELRVIDFVRLLHLLFPRLNDGTLAHQAGTSKVPLSAKG